MERSLTYITKHNKQRSLDMYTIICCVNMNDYIHKQVYTDKCIKKIGLEGIT